MALLEVRNLSVGIRQKNRFLEAVRGISFDIEAGSITAIAGESGGGKSMTALSIARLLPAQAEIASGEITFDSVLLNKCSEKELCEIRGKDISMIFQEPRLALNPLHRIGEQIAETLELHGEKNKHHAKQAALEIIEHLGLGDPEKISRSFPHQLSLGMCQRVMIAIAAICRPRLLIADEPSSALDGATQTKVLELLARINKEFGTALLFVCHDLSVIRNFCHRFMVMYAGKIVEEGPAEAITTPAHPYTKALALAVPSGEYRGKPLPGIEGRAPTIEENLPGCPFAPRCPHTHDRCLQAFPPETDLGGGRRVHCYYTEAGNA